MKIKLSNESVGKDIMPKYGYKLVLVDNYVEKFEDDDIYYRPIGAIIKIEIPDDAIVINCKEDKTKKRCSKCKFVRVEGYYNLLSNYLYKDNRIYAKDLYKMMKSKKNIAPNKNEPIKFISMYDNTFIYEKSKDIYPNYFYTENNIDCIDGIHYFDYIFEVQDYYRHLLIGFIIYSITVQKEILKTKTKTELDKYLYSLYDGTDF